LPIEEFVVQATGLIAIVFFLGFSCAPAEEDDGVFGKPNLPDKSASSDSGLIKIPVKLTEKKKGFSLADATTYSISLTDCASGYTSTANQNSSSLKVYKFDRDCLAKLTQFQLNGFTYTPQAADPFTTWQTGDTATFEVAASPSNTLQVKVISTLDDPISGTEAVEYRFSTIESGANETIADTDVGDPHTMTVAGQDAPSFTIHSVELVGITAGGAGQFEFVMECTSDITGAGATTACLDVLFTDIRYKLIEDTYGSTLTYAQAQALFPADESSVDTATEVVAVGGGGTTHGGFTTVTLDGPDIMHTHPNMILVIEAADLSYLYFNVDVTILTQD
jgi:hypothetical protein